MKPTSYEFIDKLEPQALTFLEKHLKPVSIPTGNLLFYQGEICDHILWLKSGEVRLYTQPEGIEEITLYTLKSGEQCIVNTASLFSGTAAVASAITLTDIEGWLIDTKSVKTLAKMSDVYQSYLFSLYHLRFDNLTQLINDIKFKRLDERITDWLAKQNKTVIRITHEQLATELGTSRVVVSRLLKEMEQNGNISMHRGKIELLS